MYKILLYVYKNFVYLQVNKYVLYHVRIYIYEEYLDCYMYKSLIIEFKFCYCDTLKFGNLYVGH